jgi:hypothetical protein
MVSIESRVLLFAIGLGLAIPLAARTVCCDVDGKRVCGDPPPPVCDNRAKIIYSQGGVAKEVEAPLTPEQRAAREAEESAQEGRSPTGCRAGAQGPRAAR